ncbi:energy-coupling factor transport system ATP-binding protein [Caloramator quimbayensis]|uniref:Energy-coupling factor transport system ATP-binding protein n=1 Tax=Caloramator quimbayensis TaxID=1147123 RepID=A0A1T4YF37_9CLOT|nr:ABC transporter ATP-binding protein [Caloramator quimbayensis]SKB00310.1 energy-coupling factor transport system ATP-binding protein [Caloramator quimbayensis]
MSLISFKNFSFRYKNLKAPTLKNINLDIEAGQKVLIAGPSGSGKSTLAHCINGLIPFTYKGEITGSLEINGIRPYEKSIYEISKYVGTILQDQDGQFVGLSVGEDVAFSYENDNVPVDIMHKGVNKALKEVEMINFIKEVPHNLSGGQKQKVSIAGILATSANILLFDEPLANLDPYSSKKAMDTIDSIHKNQNKTVIVVEHRIEDVLEHDFDRIIVIDNGEIVADGTPDELLPDNILSYYGLREPLYIEVLKSCNIRLSKEDKISKIENVKKFKDSIVKDYNLNSKVKDESDKKVVLSVENISYKYYKDSEYVIKDISFNINSGEVMAILGNNGAGKSTLLKVISGIARQQEGTIKYMGEPIDRWSVKKRGQVIGYVMQNPNHMITKNIVFDEVAFGLRNNGYDEDFVKKRVEDTLKVCSLYQYRNWPIMSLSYGQRKRVTIASILAMQPKIIILDEPTAGQDYRNYREFMSFLDDIKKTGISIVMITHDMHLALEYAQRAVVMSEGRLIINDTVYNVLSNKEIIERANLKETSISKLAKIYDVEDKSSFLEYFTNKIKDGANC